MNLLEKAVYFEALIQFASFPLRTIDLVATRTATLAIDCRQM